MDGNDRQASRATRFPLLVVLLVVAVAMTGVLIRTTSSNSTISATPTDILPPVPEAGIYHFVYSGEAWTWKITTETTDISDDLSEAERLELERNRVDVQLDNLTDELLIWEGPGSFYQESAHIDPDTGHRWVDQVLGADNRVAFWESGYSDPDATPPGKADGVTLRNGVQVTFADIDPKDMWVPQRLLGLVPRSSKPSPGGRLITYEYNAGEGDDGTVRIVGVFDALRNVPLSYDVFYGGRHTGTVTVKFDELDASSRAIVSMSNVGCLTVLDATKAARAELGLASCS